MHVCLCLVQGDAAGPELHQHGHQPRPLMEAHQAAHAPDHSGQAPVK